MYVYTLVAPNLPFVFFNLRDIKMTPNQCYKFTLTSYFSAKL